MKRLYISPRMKVRKLHIVPLMAAMSQGDDTDGYRPNEGNAKSGFCDFDDIDEESDYSNSAW